MYMTCPMCGGTYKTIVKKSGFDTVLIIRKHFRTIPVTTAQGIMPKAGRKEVCPGSLFLGLESTARIEK